MVCGCGGAAFSENQQKVAHDYDQDALRIEFHRLTTGSLPGPSRLSDALEPDVRQGSIGFWSFDKADQPLLYRLGLAGAFPAADGHDLLGVTTQNAANNKIDVYLQRVISDAVTYDPANGAVASRVTITLHNEAPALGLPNEVIGSYTGSGLPPGTNETWLTLYSPLGLRGATVNGQRQGVSNGTELGVHAYSEYVDIPPQGKVTLTFDLAGVTTPGPGYRLSMYNQPMVQDDLDTVSVEPTSGWRVTGAPPGTLGATSPRSTRSRCARPTKGRIRPQVAAGSRSTRCTRLLFRVSLWREQQSGGHLMRHRAVGLWAGILMVGATALLGATLLVSGPAAALDPAPTDRPPSQPRSHPPRSRRRPRSSPPRSVTPGSSRTGPSSTAFTGAELALLFTIGAIAIGVGGMFVLVSRRRRAQPAYARDRR